MKKNIIIGALLVSQMVVLAYSYLKTQEAEEIKARAAELVKITSEQHLEKATPSAEARIIEEFEKMESQEDKYFKLL